MKIQWDFDELYKFAEKLANADLDETFKRITKDISKALLKRMKSLTPVDDYDLINGWNGNHFAVKEVENGFEVLIVNKTPYALYVNDGHRVRNRQGGEYYPVKRRIQVRAPHQWQDPVSDWYVYGHFFVERGIVQLTETKEIESILYRELEKWWKSV